MNIKIQVNLPDVQFDKDFSGASEADLFRQFRDEVQSRLGFFERNALRLLDDRAFIARVVEAHNKQVGSKEPIPSDVKGFFAFGRRVGYVVAS